jgi:hypothetical protein
VQVFQRQVAQLCEGQGPALMNLLDPEVLPYTLVNGSILPRPDPDLKLATPQVDDPDYASAILDFVRVNAPDTWDGQPVRFWQTFLASAPPDALGTDDPALRALVALEVWGAPISAPARDPRNPLFIYQRFQRGVMHFDADTGLTQGLLLADDLKQILRNSPELPSDLRSEARSSRFFHQYCPGRPSWLCRPAELPGTDLAFVFEPG